MKRTLILLLLSVLALSACHKDKIGYLKTTGASYLPDSLEIRTRLDPELDKVRILNNAPWVTTNIQGVLGTPTINYRLLDVKATEGGDADIFRREISVNGHGILQVPLVFMSPKGRYLVSIEAYNEDHVSPIVDAFTFIVK